MAVAKTCLLMVFAHMAVCDHNKTELHFGVHFATSKMDLTKFWTNHIVGYINNMSMIPGYEVVADFLQAPRSATRGKIILEATDYFRQTRTFCYIGNDDIERTLVTADITAAKNIVQLSPIATSHLLSEKGRYTYYASTVPSDLAKMHMLNAILLKYDWKKVAVIAKNEEPMSTLYSRFLDLLLELKRPATFTASYTDNPSEVMQRLKDSGLKIIISLSSSESAKLVMCEAHRAGLTGKGFVWINDYVGPVVGDWNAVKTPSGSNCTAKEWVKGFENQFVAVQNEGYTDGDQTILHKKIGDIKEEVASAFNASHINDTRESLKSPFFGRLADAVVTCALALNSSISAMPTEQVETIPYIHSKNLSDIMFHSIWNSTFKGISGDVSFTPAGERHAIFDILKIKKGRMGNPLITYKEAGKQIEYPGTDDDMWDHVGGVPRRDEDTVIDSKLAMNVALFYTYIVLASVAASLTLVLITAQIWFHDSSVIKYSWPRLNDIIAFGCIVLCVVVICKGIDISRVSEDVLLILCNVTNWLLVLGFTFTIGAMLTKMWAIYSFFHRQTKGKKTLHEGRILVIIVVMIIIDVSIMVAWMEVDPLRIDKELHSQEIDYIKQEVYNQYHYSCVSTNATYWIIAFFCYKGIVLILAGFITWPAWIIASQRQISDSHYLGIAVYGCILSCVICVPVSFLIQEDPSLQYGIVGGVMLASVLLTVCLLLIPKLLALREDTDERISKINSPIGALFGFMSTLADSGALPGAGVSQAKAMFAVNIATAMTQGDTTAETEALGKENQHEHDGHGHVNDACDDDQQDEVNAHDNITYDNRDFDGENEKL